MSFEAFINMASFTIEQGVQVIEIFHESGVQWKSKKSIAYYEIHFIADSCVNKHWIEE